MSRVVAGESAAVVARELGVASGTVRQWVARARAKGGPGSVGVVDRSADGDGLSRVERLRAAADRARAASSRALDAADALLAKSMASEARNASVVAGVWADRARELEEAARLEELHEVALDEAQGRLLADRVTRAFGLLGLPVPGELLGVVLQGGEPDEGLVEAARSSIRRPIEAEVRREVLAELEAQRVAVAELPAGVDDGEEIADAVVVEEEVVADDGGQVRFEDLPEEWKRRYRLRPDLGVHEFVNAERRRALAVSRGRPIVGGRHRFDFSHPGLRG